LRRGSTDGLGHGTEEEKAAAAAASGRPADDSDSEEDVAAKMSKMSVNDLVEAAPISPVLPPNARHT
jgi:hypothetical protein